MKLVVSIPVHEKPEVIKNQIENFKKYIKNTSIVLHVSKTFLEHHSLDEIKNIPGVYINPEHLDTKWANIIQTHISNYLYIKNVLEFDYFILHASNDMYIRTGFDSYIMKYEAGFNIRKVLDTDSHWWPGNFAFEDLQLKEIMNCCGQSMIIASQVESSFYKKELMDKIVEIIAPYINNLSEALVYPREEIYFSTVASSLVSWDRIGDTTTFSEVHRFDRTLWRLRNITRYIYYHCGLKIFFSEKTYQKIEQKYNDWLFRSKFYKTTPHIIKRLLCDDTKYLEKKQYLDDGSGCFKLYGNMIYSVKRVNRDINDPLRKFITNLP